MSASTVLSLSRIVNISDRERVMICAKKVVASMEQIDEASLKLGLREILKDPPDRVLAYNVAGLLFQRYPVPIGLDTSRKAMKQLLLDSTLFTNDVKAELTSAANILFCEWMAILLMAPFPVDEERLRAICNYALQVQNRTGSSAPGKLIASIVIRLKDIQQQIITWPSNLRSCVLASLIDENVHVDSQILAQSLAEPVDNPELILNEMTIMTKLPEQHRLLLGMRSDPNPRIAAKTGRCLSRIEHLRETFEAHELKVFAANGGSVQAFAVNDHLALISYYEETSKVVDLSKSARWPQLMKLWTAAVKWEGFIQPQRTRAVHLGVLRTWWNLVVRRRIPMEDLRVVMELLLTLCIWHHDGLTKHTANSVLQELVGCYALHDAVDLLPNLYSESEELDISKALTERLMPVVLHSTLGFQGCVCGAVDMLLDSDHPSSLRICTVIHYILADSRVNNDYRQRLITNCVKHVAATEHTSNISSWRHAQYLCLLVALITVPAYNASDSDKTHLLKICRDTAQSWSSQQLDCVKMGAGKILCQQGTKMQPFVRFVESLNRLVTPSEMEDILDVVFRTLEPHRCTGRAFMCRELSALTGRSLNLPRPPWHKYYVQQPIDLIQKLPLALTNVCLNPDNLFTPDVDLVELINKLSKSLMQMCVPLTILVSFLDLCGLCWDHCESEVRNVFEKGLYHPENTVRMLSRVWLDRHHEITPLQIMWRFRSRQINGVDAVELGNAETIYLRPLTSPTYHCPLSPVPPISSDARSLILLGTSNYKVRAQAIAHHWGRFKYPPSDAYEGPWEKKGRMYAEALCALRSGISIDSALPPSELVNLGLLIPFSSN